MKQASACLTKTKEHLLFKSVEARTRYDVSSLETLDYDISGDVIRRPYGVGIHTLLELRTVTPRYKIKIEAINSIPSPSIF